MTSKFEPFNATLESGTTNPSPLITPYLPEQPGYNGLGIILFAGGGYRMRSEHESHGLAQFFASDGIACFVVDYRVSEEGARHPAMIEDAFAAIGTIRKRAREFGCDPRKLGVLGSSAGGHLAAHTTVAWRDFESDVSLRPDFAVLCYAVIYMHGQFSHGGTQLNLLGDNPSEEEAESVSVVQRVNEKTPPCFIWHTLGDPAVAVENSLGFATSLRVNNVPFELHIYQRGGHGLSRKTSLTWEDDCLRWLRDFADGRLSEG